MSKITEKQYNILDESVVDAFVAYKFLRLLTTPFKDTDAFKLGIIDEKGNILKKRKQLKSGKEKAAYTIFHTLIWNIKKLLEKLPAGQTRLGSFAAGLWILKEHTGWSEQDIETCLYEHNPSLGFNSHFHMLLNESEESDYLEAGEYVVTHDTDTPAMPLKVGDKFRLTSRTKATGTILGQKVFRIKTLDNKEGIVAHDTIERVK